VTALFGVTLPRFFLLASDVMDGPATMSEGVLADTGMRRPG
jgi:hypothetical protein